ncbi:ornithine carbamoyltransferase [Myriangium duriaei CBS 260.36]|uniref:Ornithine carbamoyltransferase, mitochondrial n=1 Tax=Myriangium duriaei CBS 260.36 TaxID=1168546 RepID=A0A9P4J2R2_9PEZI|nr:ornithine carbamoyltransferase [Myriangium duriaei CBS 260.36]
MPPTRPSTSTLRAASKACRRTYSTSPATFTTPATSPFAPRHLMSLSDLSTTELTALIRSAAAHKAAIKSTNATPLPLGTSLSGQTIAIMMSKRSTRTRVSTEAAIARLGGHPMFLGSGDIQLGVNESLYDTSVVISSMVSGMVARVHAHADVADLAKHSSVPVINGLSDLYHPLQGLADYLTIFETFGAAKGGKGLGLEGLKIAWVGDANNVLYDLAIGAMKLGVEVSVATPKGYEIPKAMREVILAAGEGAERKGKLTESTVPEEAIKGADIIVTDTWVSMGQEEETAKRLKDFEGFKITKSMIDGAGASEDWKFMHCLPRHPEEVADEVFYSPKSLVFQEAENRLWAAISALEAFVVNKGRI